MQLNHYLLLKGNLELTTSIGGMINTCPYILRMSDTTAHNKFLQRFLQIRIAKRSNFLYINNVHHDLHPAVDLQR